MHSIFSLFHMIIHMKWIFDESKNGLARWYANDFPFFFNGLEICSANTCYLSKFTYRNRFHFSYLLQYRTIISYFTPTSFYSVIIFLNAVCTILIFCRQFHIIVLSLF